MSLAAPDPLALLRADRRLRVLARELVCDPSAADDVAQEAWLEALGAESIRALPAWLGTVARRLATRARRGATRREERERRAARSEALPSAADILAREETRRRLVEAVLALDEPLRATLVLRFLEDLPPRVVAARMAVPVETVRSRTRRGLEELRQRLDRSFGERASWCVALAPLLRVRAPSGLLTTTLVAMSLQKKLALALALLLCILGGIVWRRAGGAGDGDERVGAVPAELHEPLEAGRDRATLAPVEVAGSRAVPALPAPVTTQDPFGSLRVSVSWSDGSGAAGVAVYARRYEDANPELTQREGRTDGAGTLILTRIPCGEISVVLDRGLHASAAIAAGVEATLAFALPRGFDVDGLVEDRSGAPIAGAEVWMARHGMLVDGTLTARTGNDGRFHLRSLAGEYPILLAACAEGFRSAESEHVSGEEGQEVRLRFVLRQGAGEVIGTVSDEVTGEPVPAAFVAVGPRAGMEFHGEGFSFPVGPWARLVRTDEGGRFRVAGLAPGTCSLAIRTPGRATWRAELEVRADHTETVHAALVPEAALAGHVLDEGGQPVRDVSVVVGRGVEWLRASDRTDAEGAFHVGALEADVELEARVYVRAEGCVAFTTFTARPGETFVWEARLGEMDVLRGRLLDEAEQPLSGWQVQIQSRDGHGDSATTGSDGSFRFENLFPREYELLAYAPGAGYLGLFPSVERSGLRPGPDEVVLHAPTSRLPTVHIQGVFLDELGRPVPGATVMPWADHGGNSTEVECEAASGRFALGPLPPGRWRLVLQAPGAADVFVGPRELGVGESWDCGEVRLAPLGRVRARLRPEGVELVEDPRLRIRQGGWWRKEGLGAEGLERSASLPPGSYEIHLLGVYDEVVVPFEVTSGAETVVDVPVRPGHRALVHVTVDDEETRFVELRVSSARSPVVIERTCGRHASSGPIVASLRLAPGTYTVEARAGGLRASGTLVVEPVDRPEPALVLRLR